MQTAERGLVISASEGFLEPYQFGREALAAAIERALKLTATDPEQSARLQKVLVLEAEWRARFLEALIDKRQALAVNCGKITFGKFAQPDSSDTRQKGGTGLGLSIANSLVEKMRGHIECLSDPGRCTIFSVALPLHASSAAAREWSDNSALT
jgi:K+-sensing histidine kinase KdpD